MMNLEERIEQLKETKILPLAPVKRLHKFLDNKRLLRFDSRVIGEFGTGKTLACLVYRDQHPAQRQSGLLPTASVIYVQAMEKMSASELFGAIIGSLGSRMYDHRVDDQRRQTQELLVSCEVEMLIIDDADRLKQATYSELCDFSDHQNIAIVLVGPERLDRILQNNENCFNRFIFCQRFGPLNQEEFSEAIQLWLQANLDPIATTRALDENLEAQLFAATDGYIGPLDQLLREAAISTWREGEEGISPVLLTKAIAEYQADIDVRAK